MRVVIHFTAATIVVATQILAWPILIGALGNTSAVEGFILAAVMGGLCIGQSGLLRKNVARVWLLVSGLCALGASLSYSELTLRLARSEAGAAAVAAFTLLIIVSAGIMSSAAIYFDDEFSENYFLHNFLAAAGIVAIFSIQILLGNHVVLALAGAALAYVGLAPNLWQRKRPDLRPRLTAATFGSLWLGSVSGVFVLCVLELMKITIYPSGFEFHFYLFFVFLHLAFSPRWSLPRRVSLPAIPLCAFGIMVSTLVVLYGGWGKAFLLDPLTLIAPLLRHPQAVAIVSFLQMALLLLPYACFAGVVPRQQEKYPGENHLFFVSLGNLLGILLPSLLFHKPPLEILLPLFFLFSVAYLFFSESGGRKVKLVVALGLAGFAGLGLGNLTKRVLVQSTRSNLALQRFKQPESYNLDNVQRLFRREGKTGFIYDSSTNLSALGLDGYGAPMKHFADLIRALSVKKLVGQRGAKNILVLGLGNQLVLKELAILKEAGGINLNVDVVDNFPPFSQPGFKEEVGRLVDLTWPIPFVHFFDEDAFRFLARRKYPAKYDAIVSNLTWPLFTGSRLLYTREFFTLMKDALAPNGFFLSLAFSDARLNCLAVQAFPRTQGYPLEGPLQSLIVSSNQEQGELTAGEKKLVLGCDGLELPTLSRLFWAQNLTQGQLPVGQGDTTQNEAISSLSRNSEREPESLLLAAQLFPSAMNSRVLLIPRTGAEQVAGREIENAAILFRSEFHKTVIILDTNSSDVLARNYYLFARVNIHDPAATAILPFFADAASGLEFLVRAPAEGWISFNPTYGNAEVPSKLLVGTLPPATGLTGAVPSLVGRAGGKPETYVQEGFPGARMITGRTFSAGLDEADEEKGRPLLIYFKDLASWRKNRERMASLGRPLVVVFPPSVALPEKELAAFSPDAYYFLFWTRQQSESACRFSRHYERAFQEEPTALAAGAYSALVHSYFGRGRPGELVSGFVGDVNAPMEAPYFLRISGHKASLVRLSKAGSIAVPRACGKN